MRPFIAALICLSPSLAHAQKGEIAATDLGKKALEGKAAETVKEGADDDGEAKDPWTFGLNLALSGSLSDSSDVVGQLNGTTTAIGVVLDGSGVWKSGQHEVENLVKIQHSQTKAPPTNVYVKSADQLDLSSTYLYYLQAVSWLGPYVRGKLSTPILAGDLVFAEDVVVTRGGDAPETVEQGDKISLTGAVEPLTLFESAGMFAKPLSSGLISLESKLGLGAQQIFVRDGVIASGDPEDTDDDGVKELTLTKLEGSTAAGAEFELAAGGQLTKNLTYGARLNLFMPMAGADLTFGDGLQTDFEAKASAKLNKWASLDYVISAKKIPAVQGPDAKFQLSNAFMVTAGFNLL